MLSHFHLIAERNGQRTDRRTDRFAVSVSRVSMMTRDKKTYNNCSVLFAVSYVVIFASLCIRTLLYKKASYRLQIAQRG